MGVGASPRWAPAFAGDSEGGMDSGLRRNEVGETEWRGEVAGATTSLVGVTGIGWVVEALDSSLRSE